VTRANAQPAIADVSEPDERCKLGIPGEILLPGGGQAGAILNCECRVVLKIRPDVVETAPRHEMASAIIARSGAAFRNQARRRVIRPGTKRHRRLGRIRGWRLVSRRFSCWRRNWLGRNGTVRDHDDSWLARPRLFAFRFARRG